MGEYKCRTCLGLADEQTCTPITDKCIDKSIKQSIIQLIPEMELTLMDDEIVCDNCLSTLQASMKFIDRCLKIEIAVQEEITKQLEYSNDIECKENFLEENVDINHDYFGKTECLSSDDYTCDDSNLRVESTLKDFFVKDDDRIEFIVDDSMSSEEDISLKSDYDITENETKLNDEMILDEYCQEESSLSLECEICREKFTTVNSLRRHEDIHSLICEICSQWFPNRKEYDSHIKLHPPFACDKCGQTFTTEPIYKRHLNLHIERDSVCDICGKKFPDMAALEDHKASHVEENSFMCDKCPRKYKSLMILERHQKQYHNKIEELECQKCGIVVSGRQKLADHNRLVHLQIKPFVCDVCGREFGRKDYLQKHMYNHTGEPRPIQQRNKLAKEKKGRGKPPKFGIRLKDPGTPVNCKICGKMIMSVHLLKSHLHSHVKIRRHKCRYCELTFTLSNNRDRHQRIHEADPNKRFRCNICWKKMETSEELEKHLVGHYNRPPQHCCDICGEKFHRKYLLDNHHLHKHTNPGDIEIAEKEIVINNLLEYAHPYL